jgi:hypothetical protein
MTLSKEIKRKLEKLEALECGGVDNWEGYEFALEEYNQTIGREETAEDIIDVICEVLCAYIIQPAGSGCGYGFSQAGIDNAVGILLRRAGELK